MIIGLCIYGFTNKYNKTNIKNPEKTTLPILMYIRSLAFSFFLLLIAANITDKRTKNIPIYPCII